VPVDERLAGTLACTAWAYTSGAHMIRVHDVAPAVQVLRLLEAISRA